jgi:hypothetical protein
MERNLIKKRNKQLKNPLLGDSLALTFEKKNIFSDLK